MKRITVDPPWLEGLLALSLAIAGLFTTWATYQSALWDGEQMAHYGAANATRIEASRVSDLAGQAVVSDLVVFGAWLEANGANDARLMDFYEARFRKEFRPAFQAWIALKPLENPRAAPSPFAMPQYRSGFRDEARKLTAKADDLFDRGQKDNDISDTFVLSTVLLGGSMFFAGICQTFKKPHVRLPLALLSAFTCALGVLRAMTLPSLVIHLL